MASDDGVPANPATLGALRRAIAARLRAAFAGSEGRTPDLDARLLVAAAAGVEPAALMLRDDARIDAAIAERALSFAARRATGEPVARILGRKEFWGLSFALSPQTLVPRPDTETVVEAALTFVSARDDAAPLRLLDLGTGTGAILLALLSELPRATGVGVDVSFGAAATARGNAAALGLAGRAGFVVGDWMAAITGRFDVVVANPPYIATAAIAGLDPEVSLFDPLRALDGGEDGLTAIRAILADVARVLAPGGGIFVEIGAGQGEAIAALAAERGFAAALVADLAGIDRVVVLRR